MKKIATILISFLVIFLILGCKWEIPEGIDFKGRVGVKNLTINLDLSKEISKAIKDQLKFEDDGSGGPTITVQECVNAPDVITLLAHLKIPMDNFKIPDAVDYVDEMNEDIENWLDTTYSPFVSGDVEEFIEAQIDKISNDFVGDSFLWEGVTITISDEWKEKLKQELLDSVEGVSDPDEINEIIKETIKDTASDVILETEITVGGENEAKEYELDSFKIEQIDISDFIDFAKIETDDFKAAFYLSVSDLDGNESNFFDGIQLKMDLGSKTIFDYEPIETHKSGIDTSKSVFEGTSIPAGMMITFSDIIESGLFSNQGGEIDSVVEIKVQENDFLLSDLTKEYKLDVEMVIWLPISITVKEGEEYSFKLPLPDDGDDLFGRSDQDSFIEYIQGAGFELVFGKPVFSGMYLVIDNRKTGSFYREFPLSSGTSMRINFSSKDMDDLNKDYPFKPEISLLIEEKGGLNIYKDLKLERFSIHADLKIEKTKWEDLKF